MARYGLSRTAWRRSSYSGQDGNCLEVARDLPGVVAVRDSKDRAGPALTFTVGQWLTFTAWIKADQSGQA
ncbi:MAG TPA: DUF397 domain-containing protein [Streptosporangiaceae bacterium]